MMTETEKKLLRQQAEAYAFIHNLRRTALVMGDKRYIRLTEGIDARISKRQKEYPTLFKRYFNGAIRRAEQSTGGAEENIDSGKGISERKKEEEEARQAEKSSRESSKKSRKKKVPRNRKKETQRQVKRDIE